MLDPTTAMEIGRLQGTLSITREETHRRIDDAVRYIGGRLTRLEVRVDKMGKNGRRTSSPWLQLAAMGTIAISALMGLVKPEAAAAILRALLH